MFKSVRKVRIEGSLAYVPLTQGYEAIIDADDVHLVAGVNWYALVKRHTVYVVRKGRKVCGGRSLVMMHRVIMGAPVGMLVDHVSCDGLDNRRANLRLSTKSQNQQNKRLSMANTSGFKGVTWHRGCLKWQSKIVANGRSVYLGLYSCPQEAHAAYCEASKRLHGEFGRTS